MATAKKSVAVEVELTLDGDETMALYELLGDLYNQDPGVGEMTLPGELQGLLDELHRELITG